MAQPRRELRETPGAFDVRQPLDGSQDRVVRIVERAVRRSGHDEGVLLVDRLEQAGIRRRRPPGPGYRRDCHAAREPDGNRQPEPGFPSRAELGPQAVPNRPRHTRPLASIRLPARVTGHGSLLSRDGPTDKGGNSPIPGGVGHPVPSTCADSCRGPPRPVGHHGQPRRIAKRVTKWQHAAGAVRPAPPLAALPVCRGGRSSTSPEGLGGSSGTGSPRSSGACAVTSNVRAGD